MKAAVFNRKNKTQQINVQEVEKPSPKDHEVLIRIKSVSLNAADYRSIQFHIVPKHGIMGADVSGVVEEVGKSVQQFKAGDEVVADLSSNQFGGLAEFAVAPEKLVVNKPASLSFESASALPMAGFTALQAIRNVGQIKKGSKVLVAGSGGGVGTMAVQLAKHFGAEVDAVCGPNNIAQSKLLGAKNVFDYTIDDFAKSKIKYDLILAVNGNHSLATYKKMLNKNGIYVMVGGALPQIFGSLLFGWLYSFGSRKMKSLAAKSSGDDLQTLVNLAANGELKAMIDRTYTLDQTNEAMNYITAGHARGKVVINID